MSRDNQSTFIQMAEAGHKENMGQNILESVKEPDGIRHKIRQTQDLPQIGERNSENLEQNQEEENNGANTYKPTSPQHKDATDKADPKNGDEEIPKSMKTGLIIGGIALTVIVLGLTLAVVIFTISKFKATVQNQESIQTSHGSIQTKTIKATDTEVFNSDIPLKIYTSRFSQSPIPSSQNGRSLSQVNFEYPTYTFRDQSTGIVISVSSKDLQLRVSVDVPSVLENVLNNQQLPENIEDGTKGRNLLGQSDPIPQQGPVLYQQLTFFQVANKIAEEVKKTCSVQDNNTKVSQQVSHDITYNKDIGSFEFVPMLASTSVSAESVAFFDASKTPVIKNYNNETEVAAVVTTVIVGVINKAKDFLQKRLSDIQKVSQVKLPQTDNSNGETSIYIDQPSDFSKLCSNINDSVLRCNSRALSSKVINLAAPKETQTYDQIPTLVVLIDV